VVVFDLDVADAGFHPRFDAISRHYQYTVYRAAVRHPFYARYCMHVEQDLDVEAMSRATRCLLGCHDFLAFGSPPQGDNAVRDVIRAGWSFEEPWLRFDIEANAFLYRMVRMLVGTLLRVGSGALAPEAFGEILETRSRERAGPAVVAGGLCLKSVAYASGR
jgi:tRNA pseudouridine38-40 synthase